MYFAVVDENSHVYKHVDRILLSETEERTVNTELGNAKYLSFISFHTLFGAFFSITPNEYVYVSVFRHAFDTFSSFQSNEVSDTLWATRSLTLQLYVSAFTVQFHNYTCTTISQSIVHWCFSCTFNRNILHDIDEFEMTKSRYESLHFFEALENFLSEFL